MEEKLNALIDNQFIYKEKPTLIKSWKKVNSLFVVHTDSQTYNFYENELNGFFESLLPLPAKQPARWVPKAKTEEVIETEKTSEDLTTILYETINNVRKNPDYIQQANAICNVVSQMINIKKLELQIKSTK